MKIRNGFVSNSSSSSFLVFFPEEINDYQQLFDIIWCEKNISHIKNNWKFNGLRYIKSDRNAYHESFEEFQKDATEFILKEIKEQVPDNYLLSISRFYKDYYYDKDTDKLYGYDIGRNGVSLNQITGGRGTGWSDKISAKNGLDDIKNLHKRYKILKNSIIIH